MRELNTANSIAVNRNVFKAKNVIRTGFAILSLIACIGLLAGCDVSNDIGANNQQGADPVVVDYPIAFVARSLPFDDDGGVMEQDILNPAAFSPGAQLVIKERARSAARETFVTEGLFPEGLIDIKDLNPSYEGTKLVFAMRAPEIPEADEDQQPTWNIWEYDLTTQALNALLPSGQAAQGHDVAPNYLPDGRIVFTSTRQKRAKAILLDEEKAQFASQDEDLQADAFNLHIYDPSSQEISQLTFNPSHDVQPTVMNDGRIVFLRWDNMLNNDALSFYTINPDGSALRKLYGYNSQNTGPDNTPATFWHARQMPNDELLINLRARKSRNWGGDIVSINTANFIDANTPNPQNPSGGSAQQSVSPLPVNISEAQPKPFSLGGLYNSAFALNDNTGRLITSWSPCRVFSADDGIIYPCADSFINLPNTVPAAPNFGLWILDNQAGTLKPLKPATETTLYTDVVVLYPNVAPPSPSQALNINFIAQGVGAVNIRSVYDFDGNLPDNLSPNPALADPSLRPARFIRIVKSVGIPDDSVLDFDRSAFGLSRAHLMRDIIGYVPIEDDGSAYFKVPANIPVMLNLVDATGKRLNNTLFGDARHENWLTVEAGETFNCVGCHDASDETPSAHGRADAEASTGFTAVGQTLAEQFTATYSEPRTPTIDLLYQDVWSDPANMQAPIALAYANIAPNDAKNLPPFLANNCIPSDGSADTFDPVAWQRPTRCNSSVNTSPFAPSQWNSLCRITLNYEEHIQPLWERDRRQCSPMQAEPANTQELIADYTCTRCHSANYRDANNAPLAPAKSLFLTREMPVVILPNEQDSTAITIDNNCNQTLSADYAASYPQLLRGRLALSIDTSDGSLLPSYTTESRDTLDEDGNPVLNDDGSVRQTIVRTCQREGAPAVSASAQNSRFFELFTGNDTIHGGIMSASELHLIAQWLDIGAQYYNNPFDAPLDN